MVVSLNNVYPGSQRLAISRESCFRRFETVIRPFCVVLTGSDSIHASCVDRLDVTQIVQFSRQPQHTRQMRLLISCLYVHTFVKLRRVATARSSLETIRCIPGVGPATADSGNPDTRGDRGSPQSLGLRSYFLLLRRMDPVRRRRPFEQAIQPVQ